MQELDFDTQDYSLIAEYAEEMQEYDNNNTSPVDESRRTLTHNENVDD